MSNSPQIRSPLVSVVVPCYNYAHFLPDTLESLMNQTYSDWECIIINDGSTDNTQEVSELYKKKDNRIKYVYQKNKGLSAARNTGIRTSSGQYLLFLDADDLITHKKLEAHIEVLEKDTSIDIHYGIAKFFFGNDVTQLYLNRDRTSGETWMPMVSGGRDELLPCLLDWNIMVVSSPILRRCVVHKVGLFDETLKSLEDWDYWLRCALSDIHMRYQDSADIATYIRVTDNSMITNTITMQLSEIKIRKRIKNTLKSNEELLKKNEKLIELRQKILYKDMVALIRNGKGPSIHNLRGILTGKDLLNLFKERIKHALI